MKIRMVKGHDSIEKNVLSLNKLTSIVKKTHKEKLIEDKKGLLKRKERKFKYV